MLERFREAIGTGEILRVVYDGGSSPGTVRDLLALQILEDGMVRAKCLTTGLAKTFALAKMRLPENEPETYALAASKGPRYSNLAKAFESHALEIRTMGWHIQLEDEEEDGQCLSVHRVKRSSGQPMKGSFASLTFTPVQFDLMVMPDGRLERANVRASTKPSQLDRSLLPAAPVFGTSTERSKGS